MTRLSFLMIAALAFPLTAIAQPGSGRGMGRGMGQQGQGPGMRGQHKQGGPLINMPVERLTEILGLSLEQSTQILKIRADFKASTKAQREAMKTAHKALRAQCSSGDVPAKADVIKLLGPKRAARMFISDKAIDAKLAILTVLKPEQRKQLASLRGKRGKRGGRGGGGGGMGR